MVLGFFKEFCELCYPYLLLHWIRCYSCRWCKKRWRLFPQLFWFWHQCYQSSSHTKS